MSTPFKMKKKLSDLVVNPKKAKRLAGKQGIKKTIGKLASRFMGPIGWGLAAYDVVTTAPKIAKATMKGLKEKAKSGNVNIGRKL